MKRLKYIFLTLLFLGLTACGGGNGSSGLGSIVSHTGALSVMVTDDMTTQYSKIWVTVLKVTALDSSGQQHVLYDDATGQVYNLTELNGVTALLSTQDLPPDTYNNFEITLANDISLVDKQGQTIQASFNTTGDPEVIQIQGSVTITAGGVANMGIDFDLKQFTYDQTTGIVTPVLIYLDDNHLQQISLNRARVEGVIAEIIDAQTFTLQNRYGSTVTVTLQTTATIFNENTGAVGGDTSALTVGQKVEVFGSYDPGTMTIEAISAKIHDNTSPSGSPDSTEVKGVVTSFDGSTLVLDVRESNFIPGSTTLEISNVANALFTKGSLDVLAAGQWVEIYGTWEDPLFTALVVEIEGGTPRWNDGHDFDSEHHDYGYAELKGLVTGMNGTVLSLQLTERDHITGQSMGTADIDISIAWLKNGNQDCLTDGAFVEVKGANDSASGNFMAYTIEIKSSCSLTSSNDSSMQSSTSCDPSMQSTTSCDSSMQSSDSNDSSASSANPGNYVELGCLITAIDGNTITISVIHSEYLLSNTTEAVIDVTNAWYDHGTQQMLTLNRYIEVNGSWDGSQVSAVKVEFK